MPNAPFWLLKFDPAADYLYGCWPIGFTVKGMQPKPGQSVNKADFLPRTLEAYYDKRWVVMAQPADKSAPSMIDRPFGMPLNDVAQASVAPEPEPVAADVPARRKGRPKGSKNKKTKAAIA